MHHVKGATLHTIRTANMLSTMPHPHMTYHVVGLLIVLGATVNATVIVTALGLAGG